MTDQPTPEPSGLHGIDFDGFLAVFCERENLLATYPHTCPEPGVCLGRDMDCGRPLPCPDHLATQHDTEASR